MTKLHTKDFISNFTNLKVIDISYNVIIDEGMLNIIDEIEKNSEIYIEKLFAGGCGLSSVSLERICNSKNF